MRCAAWLCVPLVLSSCPNAFAGEDRVPREGTAAFVAAGMSYRDIYGISVLAEGATLGGGRWSRYWDAYWIVDEFVGATRAGLLTSQVGVGFVVEGGFPRAHFGGGAALGGTYIQRATTGGMMQQTTTQVWTQATADLVRRDACTLFVVPRLVMDFGPRMIGGDAQLGVRIVLQ